MGFTLYFLIFFLVEDEYNKYLKFEDDGHK